MANIFALFMVDGAGSELFLILSLALIFACAYWLIKRSPKQNMHLSGLARTLIIGVIISAGIIVLAVHEYNNIQSHREQANSVRAEQAERAKQEELRYSRLSESEQIDEGCSSIARARAVVSEIMSYQVKRSGGEDVQILYVKDPERHAQDGISFYLCPAAPITADSNRATVDDLKAGVKIRVGYKFVHGRNIVYKIEVL